ncbi:hypothetical protein ACFWHW_11515 [Streptomyces pharetrae]|uniref:hypothetical protein n=1 Tax=Streptomyces pharetrae TaxID=291370 RepID=UPI003655F28C
MAPWQTSERSAAACRMLSACGYLRDPEVCILVPGPDFARRIRRLLATAVERTEAQTVLPAPVLPPHQLCGRKQGRGSGTMSRDAGS